MISIVLPARNEAVIIRGNLERLLAFLHASLHEEWRVVVAVNGSTDRTAAIVRSVAGEEPHVECLELPEAGKGRAVLTAWTHAVERSTSNAQHSTFVFMDADLATDLAALPKLVATIHSDAGIAVGSRYASGARVERNALRRIVSRAYRILLHMLFGLRVSDAPCGFKAVSARVVREIVPRIRDMQWFFDTELLIRAQAADIRIVEIPVAWHEPRRGASFGKVPRIIASDLRAMVRLWQELRT